MLRGFIVAAFLVGCTYDPDLAAPDEPADPAGAGETSMMHGFSFVVDGALAGMPSPGAASLDRDLGFLAAQDIELLVSLTEAGIDPVAAIGHGITVLHLPVRDFTAPTLAQLDVFVRATRNAIHAGRTVGVHCGAGLGRTGTFLSAFFVATGMTADDAIAHVRALRPGSVETAAQEQSIRDYAAALARQDRAPITEL